MAYKKISFKTGDVLTANALNHMEEGIIAAEGVIRTTYAELVAARNAKKLEEGRFYRITDYYCTTTQENTRAALNKFDIIVLALSNDIVSEEAYAVHHDGSDNFRGVNISAWRLWYCLDNDTVRFNWALPCGYEFNGKDKVVRIFDARKDFKFLEDSYHVATSIQLENPDINYVFEVDGSSYYLDIHGHVFDEGEAQVAQYHDDGTGVIYRMIDEWGNDCPYDFKNILFSRDAAGDFEGYQDMYTFCYLGSPNDQSNTGEFCNNVIKPNGNKLNNIVFGDASQNNTFELGCYDICMTEGGTRNKFGMNCGSILLWAHSADNIFGNNCNEMEIDDSAEKNIFGDGCSDIYMGANAKGNIFGIGCYGISCGECFEYNEFAHESGDISFVSDEYDGEPIHYVSHNKIDGSELTIINHDTSATGSQLKNYNIMKLKSETIQLSRGRHNETFVAYDYDDNVTVFDWSRFLGGDE